MVPRETTLEVVPSPPHVCTHTYKHINTHICTDQRNPENTEQLKPENKELFVAFAETDHAICGIYIFKTVMLEMGYVGREPREQLV